MWTTPASAQGLSQGLSLPGLADEAGPPSRGTGNHDGNAINLSAALRAAACAQNAGRALAGRPWRRAASFIYTAALKISAGCRLGAAR